MSKPEFLSFVKKWATSFKNGHCQYFVDYQKVFFPKF